MHVFIVYHHVPPLDAVLNMDIAGRQNQNAGSTP